MSEIMPGLSTTSVEVPQNLTLSIPQERRFAIREKDWSRVRGHVETLKSSDKQFSSIAWAAVGFASSAALSALTWFPAFEALAIGDQLAFAWIGPALVAAAILGTVVALIMFWAAGKTKTSQGVSVDQVLKDLDDLKTTDSP